MRAWDQSDSSGIQHVGFFFGGTVDASEIRRLPVGWLVVYLP